jgi:hypothetical protein
VVDDVQSTVGARTTHPSIVNALSTKTWTYLQLHLRPQLDLKDMAKPGLYDRPESDLALKDLDTLLLQLHNNVSKIAEHPNQLTFYHAQKLKAVR